MMIEEILGDQKSLVEIKDLTVRFVEKAVVAKPF